MSPELIIKLLSSSGITDILKSLTNNNEKMKLEFINILISNMDEQGKCTVKDVLKEVMDDKRWFNFIGKADE